MLMGLQRAEEQSSAMRSMQQELDELRDLRRREALQAQEDREELSIFRDRCARLEEENELRQGSVIIIYLSKKGAASDANPTG